MIFDLPTKEEEHAGHPPHHPADPGGPRTDLSGHRHPRRAEGVLDGPGRRPVRGREHAQVRIRPEPRSLLRHARGAPGRAQAGRVDLRGRSPRLDRDEGPVGGRPGGRRHQGEVPPPKLEIGRRRHARHHVRLGDGARTPVAVRPEREGEPLLCALTRTSPALLPPRRWWTLLPMGGISRVSARLLVFAWALAIVLAWAAAAGAQSQEAISSYRADITIQADGSLLVVEAIDYDFGPTAHHGIF